MESIGQFHQEGDPKLIIPEYGDITVLAAVRVPEYLAPGQNFLDQPPFSLLPAMDIVPVDFFPDEDAERKGWATMIRWIAHRRPTRDERNSDYWRKVRTLSSGRFTVPQVISYADKVKDFLESFPFVLEYLGTFWNSFYFDAVGDPKPSVQQQPWKTYAAYASSCINYERGAMYAGLEELLPDASAAQDVIEALPDAGPVYRWYSLVVKSDALR